MKKLLLSLLCAAFAIIAHADTYDSGKINKAWSSTPATATLNNVDWELVANWTTGSYYGNDNSKGFQLGSSSSQYSTATFSTEGINGTITSIKVNGSTASSGKCAVSIKVGDTDFLYNNSKSVNLTTTATEYEFTGIGSGKVTITYTSSAKKGTYLKQIKIEYTTVTKTQATLTWSKESDNIKFGEQFEEPTLTVAPAEAASAVVYESSNPELLSVETNGTMTLVPNKAGTATVTASIPYKNEKYMATPAEYTIIVTDPNAAEATIVFSEEGLNNAAELTTFYKTPVTFTFAQGSNTKYPPKYYSSDETARLYAENTLTISTAEGYNITSIKAEGTSLDKLTSDQTGYDNGTWNAATGAEINSVVFTATDKPKFTKITVIYARKKVDQPAAPTIWIDGNEITNFEDNYNLNNSTKTVTITAAEGTHIYHKFAVSAPASEVEAQAETTADGFTHVEGNEATLTISTNGTLSFYAADPATGAKSDTKTLTFNNGSSSISEIEAEGNEAARWYDLQGRRVAAPAKGNVYIIKQGSKTSKRVL